MKPVFLYYYYSALQSVLSESHGLLLSVWTEVNVLAIILTSGALEQRCSKSATTEIFPWVAAHCLR